MSETVEEKSFREKMHEIIFEADTKYGTYFDAALLVSIIGSIIAVSLESVDMPAYQHLAEGAQMAVGATCPSCLSSGLRTLDQTPPINSS